MAARPPRFLQRLALLCALTVAAAWATPVEAQYFGRNKLRYHTFKFQVLKTEHFDVYYYPAEQEGAALAARLAERWYVRLRLLLGHDLRGRQPLILYASHPQFEETNIIGEELTEGTGGVTEPVRRRIVLPLAGSLADTDHVIGHELVHAFQYDMTSRPDESQRGIGLSRLPLWFVEGMAEYLSIGSVDPLTAMWMRDAARQETLPTIRDLNDSGKYFPYRWGQAFWAYVAGRWGERVISQMLMDGARAGSADAAIEAILGMKPGDLSKDWQGAIRQTYEPILTSAAPAGQVGRVLVRGRAFGAEMNVGPALSPDGRWLAFLSERSYFSVDLYLAEVATGRIVRRLTRTATNPHFTSLQFIHSAGAWDAASQRVAVAAVARGRASLAILDVSTGTAAREIPVPGVDEILNPTWAPDGRSICFTGMRQGLTDLFLYDLATNTVRQLTADAFTDLQPAWSPDGSRIAFVTDRFSSNLDTLAIGELRLAVLDPAGGAITPVKAFEAGKHITPQWTPDSRALLFVSDRDGIPNVYRLALADGTLTQLTTSGTGVSGITRTSPALSVAATAGTVAVTLFEGGLYNIALLDATEGTAPVARPVTAAILPPAERTPGDVVALLANPTFGLPPPGGTTENYKARLSLDSIGQPSVGVGVSRFGTTVGGGISFYLSDMLQDHQLATAVQFNSSWNGSMSLKDTGAQAAYINQSRRLNWGAVGGQMPYLSGGFASGVGRTPAGDLVETDELYLYRQTEQSAAGVLAYPLDRARRVEGQAGVSHVSFEQVVTTQTYSLLTGRIYEDTTVTTPLARSLTLATTSAAFVSDTSAFGATSPVSGQRYRAEVSPVFGTLNFAGVLADYRRYVMPVPFYTVAFRAMHYGRYGVGAEDSRLFPLYIGYPGLVRGYDTGSIDATDCVPTATSDCPVLDRLIGSRMFVGNVELRFPLLRPFGVSRAMYGPLPVEVGLFADGGIAWNRGQRPSLLGGSRHGVGSAGVAFRVNVLGFLVAEFDVVRPFQRTTRGWTFAFNLVPGW